MKWTKANFLLALQPFSTKPKREVRELGSGMYPEVFYQNCLIKEA